MGQPASKTSASDLCAGIWRRVTVFVSGIAADFWKDGKELGFGANSSAKGNSSSKGKNVSATQRMRMEAKSFAWKASVRPQIVETMWGMGHCLPGGDSIIDAVVAPISSGGNLEEHKDVLDLSANMGAIGRRLATRFDAYVTGFEEDGEIAKYGTELSAQEGRANQVTVEAYDPNSFVSSRQYSFVVARELFYRVADKNRFFKEINKCLKPKEPRGQMVFTDYIIESDQRDNPAVQEWLAYEKNAQPVSLDEMVKIFEKNNVDVRVSEDLTQVYINEILKALSKFTNFLQKYPPDRETKTLISKEVELWSFRIAALKSGLKFYRFYGIKN